MTTDLRAIGRDGVLRAAINTGNRALVQVDGDRLTGVSPALARRLADTIGARLETVVYAGAGKVFDDAEADRWDVAFLAIDPLRARKVSFTRPYHVIEATLAARHDAPFQSVSDADRQGTTILTSTGSAYDLFLRATIKAARLEHSGTPGESFDEFKAGRADLVAGVRASLERHFGNDPAYRIFPDTLTKVEQAMVLPGQQNPLIGALDAFVADALEEGFVSAALA